MDQTTIQQAAEIWTLRRTICDLQLEIIRRDTLAAQAARAEEAAKAEPKPTPPPRRRAKPVADSPKAQAP